MRREVVIAGGGLAGLSLAAGLCRRGVPVTVHEAGRYPRHRVCGEFISGVEDEVLEELGIDDCFEGAGRPQEVAWYRKGKVVREDRLPEPARAISRHVLDQRLGERVRELGGGIVEASRMKRESKEGVVWAAGRIATRSRWVGLKCHVPGLGMSSGLEMHLGKNGYAGLCPVEDGRVNVCGLFQVDRAMVAKGSGLLTAYLRAGGQEVLAERLEAAGFDEDSFCAVAGFEMGWQKAPPELCVIGDAGGMIPPFTGNGMSMAFQGAASALDPLSGWSEGRGEWPEVVGGVRRRLTERFERRLAAAGVMQRVLLSRLGQQAVGFFGGSRWLPFGSLLSLVR